MPCHAGIDGAIAGIDGAIAGIDGAIAGIDGAIPGARRPAQVEENAAAADLPAPSAETLEAIERIYAARIRPLVHHYCGQAAKPLDLSKGAACGALAGEVDALPRTFPRLTPPWPGAMVAPNLFLLEAAHEDRRFEMRRNR